MIIKNKTEVYVKHIGRLFAPGESIIIPDEEVYEHRDFEIIKEKKIKKPKRKKEVKNDSTHKNTN